MTNSNSINREVIMDHCSAKLAAAQLQLLDLARQLDEKSRLNAELSLRAKGQASADVVSAEFCEAESDVYTALRAENDRLNKEVAEWRAFRQSRTYRLNQRYARLYERPVIGSLLRTSRKVIAKLWGR